jgi:alkylation response protein AidB-like acyl-CoA dehydrogenase
LRSDSVVQRWIDNSLCEIAFADCSISAENLLFKEGRGLPHRGQGTAGSRYCRGTVVERVCRDLRVLRIYEGASTSIATTSRQLLA